MRGKEILLANAAALVAGLALFFAFRPPHGLALAGLFLAGGLVVQVAQSRRPIPGQPMRGVAMRGMTLILNALYGSFFAFLAFYLILALAGQIGYPSNH